MSKIYEKHAKIAAEASEHAHKRDIGELHDLAASHHRIAAEHAYQADLHEQEKMHRQMDAMHQSAMHSCMADYMPDDVSDEHALTGKQIHLGARAHADFKDGRNPPSWVEDEDKWDDAKTAAAKTYDLDDDAYWPVVVHIYENMGGDVGGEAKARMAANRLGGIASRRMGRKRFLMASIKDNGYSLKDLQSAVQLACEKLPEFASTKEAPSCPCVCDLEEEKDDTWQATVYGNAGELHRVQFKINTDHEVELIGEPKELKTAPEFVAAEEAEAKAANTKAGLKLEAGDFKGNQHKSAKEVAAEYSTAAHVATREAHKASRDANKADPVDKAMHDLACAKHESARQAHETAAAKHNSAGNEEEASDHSEMASMHTEKKAFHSSKSEAAGQHGGGYAEGKDASKPGAILCRNIKFAKQLTAVPVIPALDAKSGNPVEEGIMMYMPGGVYTIHPSQDGNPVTVAVLVNAATAETMEKQRKALTSKGKKPFFSVQHETEIAAFWPTEFFWGERLDATGAKRLGVWVRGMWTKSGKEAVEGRDFRTFSPTFFVDSLRTDERNPALVICNEDARANMGALENDPAFQAMAPLWCSTAKEALERNDIAIPTNRTLVLVAHAELEEISNPSLADLRMAMWKRHNIRISLEEVASCLN